MSYLRMKEKPKKGQYHPDAMTSAYQACLGGMSVYRAARQFAIPESTLRDRTLGFVDGSSSVSVGAPKLLSDSEEKPLVAHIKYMAGIGYGYSKKDVCIIATNYAMSVGKKSSSDPALSDRWFYKFMKRNEDLKLTKPRKLALIRARATSQETVEKYFQELGNLMTQNNISNKPENIFNIDETGISMEHRPPSVVSATENKVQAVTSPRASNVTIIGAGNALGNYIPPYYIFPGKRWNASFLENCCAGSAGEMSETGWSNSQVFLNYLKNHFIPYVQPKSRKEPVLILFDGHKSHVSLSLKTFAEQNNLILFVLPPHTSHLLQPLDVACFGPLKMIYSRECQQFMRQNPGCPVTKYVVGELSSKAYLKAMSPTNLTSAFKRTGIYPFNNNVITELQLAPSIIYGKDEGGESPDVSENNGDGDDVQNNNNNNGNSDEVHNSDNNNNNNNGNDDVLHHCENNNNGNIKVVSKSNNIGNNKCGNEKGKGYLDSIKIVKVSSEPKKKSKQTVVGNLANDMNTDFLTTQNEKKRKATKETGQSRKKLKFDDKQPGPSGIVPEKKSKLKEKKRKAKTPKAKDTDSWDSEELTADESESCCVCRKFQPPQLKGIVDLVIVKWAECDTCGHWTHLTYCTLVRTVRRSSVFECPHCNPNTSILVDE